MNDFPVHAEETTSLAISVEEHKWTYLRARSLVEQGLLDDLEKTVSALEDYVPGSFELKTPDGADTPLIRMAVYASRGPENSAVRRMEATVENHLCMAHHSKYLFQHTKFVERLLFARRDMIVFQTPEDKDSVSIFDVKKSEISDVVEMKASELNYLVRTLKTSNEDHGRKVLRRAINKRNKKQKREMESEAPDSPRLF